MWEVPLLAVISELVHRYRSPESGVPQALDELESKLVEFSALTKDVDMSRFHLMDFGTRRRFRAKYSRLSLNACSKSPGLSAPVTTIWPAAFH